MIDVIGDVHGCADALVTLLERLGYARDRGVYRHPGGRRAIFVGDLIDRGPKIRAVLDLVRAMVDTESALVVMGNHELNALAYHTPDPARPGEFLRPHTPSKVRQHADTLAQIPRADDWEGYLDWFRTLPLWLDLGDLRVVHACWDDEEIALLSRALDAYGGVTTPFLVEATTKTTPLYNAIEDVLKGKELPLPEGISFQDKGGVERHVIRIKWYAASQGQTFASYALSVLGPLPPIPLEDQTDIAGYPATSKPVIVGHYWMRDATPRPLADNVACVDYSAVQGGMLCAYRWDGESKLLEDNFVCVATPELR